MTVAHEHFDGQVLPTPVVGEVYALRTFRVDDRGNLIPVALMDSAPWTSGLNTATCLVRSHDAPGEGCKCGFYAYSDPAWVDYMQARHVQAVVECSGRAIVGSRGVRAQHARIAALWLSSAIPKATREAVTRNYPEAEQFETPEVMVESYPLTRWAKTETPAPVLSISRALKVFAVVMATATVAAVALMLHGWGGFEVPASRYVFCVTVLLLFIVSRVVRNAVGRKVILDIPSRAMLPTTYLSVGALGFTLGTGNPFFGLGVLAMSGWAWIRDNPPFRAVERFGALDELAARKPFTVDPGWPQVTEGMLLHRLSGKESSVHLVQPLTAAKVGENCFPVVPVNAVLIDLGGGVMEVHLPKRKPVHLSIREAFRTLQLPDDIWVPSELRTNVDRMLATTGQPQRWAVEWPHPIPLFKDPALADTITTSVHLATQAAAERTWEEIRRFGPPPRAVPKTLPSRPYDAERLRQGWETLLNLPAETENRTSLLRLFQAVERTHPEWVQKTLDESGATPLAILAEYRQVPPRILHMVVQESPALAAAVAVYVDALRMKPEWCYWANDADGSVAVSVAFRFRRRGRKNDSASSDDGEIVGAPFIMWGRLRQPDSGEVGDEDQPRLSRADHSGGEEEHQPGGGGQ